MSGVLGWPDPRPYTLRQLVWASQARQRAEWARTAELMAWVAGVWSGAKIDPRKLNPYDRDVKRAPPKTREQLEVESRAAWKVIDRFFTGE